MVPLFSVDKLHLLEFKFIKGEINSPFALTEKSMGAVQFEVAFNMGFHPGKKLVKAELDIRILSVGSALEAEAATANFEFVYIFKIDNFSQLITEDKTGILVVDPMLANAIAQISYSSTRGVLLTRLQGTVFSSFIMPIMDPKKLVEQRIDKRRKVKAAK